MKKISVIIPAFNEERYIQKTLSALQQQTFPREFVEIIVVNNVSTDRTEEFARMGGADIVVAEPTKGTNRARQTGLEHASGDVIAFLDADCIPPQWWLEKIYEKLHQNRDSFVALAGTYKFAEDITEPLYIYEQIYTWLVLPTLNSLMGKVFKKGGVIIGGNFAAFRETFNKINGIDTSFTFFGDDASIAKNLGTLGLVNFDPTLYVTTSARRFEREGLVKTNWEYAKNYFKVMLS
ncbi:MAG: glycosyltransferase [Patescibacteria group bacterium]